MALLIFLEVSIRLWSFVGKFFVWTSVVLFEQVNGQTFNKRVIIQSIVHKGQQYIGMHFQDIFCFSVYAEMFSTESKYQSLFETIMICFLN